MANTVEMCENGVRVHCRLVGIMKLYTIQDGAVHPWTCHRGPCYANVHTPSCLLIAELEDTVEQYRGFDRHNGSGDLPR
jgi:hypothetical protein